MPITGHELTALPSVVAAIAIIGGYVGVRSANQNTLNLAREERSSRQKDELDALKRSIYAKYDATLSMLVKATVDVSQLSSQPVSEHLSDVAIAAIQNRMDMLASAHTLLAELRFVAPDHVSNLASEAENAAGKFTMADDTAYIRSLVKLRFAMLEDLHRSKVPTAAELESFADNALAGSAI
jgi:hypothetical protein